MAQETKKPEEQKKEERKPLRPRSFHINIRTCGAMPRL